MSLKILLNHNFLWQKIFKNPPFSEENKPNRDRVPPGHSAGWLWNGANIFRSRHRTPSSFPWGIVSSRAALLENQLFDRRTSTHSDWQCPPDGGTIAACLEARVLQGLGRALPCVITCDARGSPAGEGWPHLQGLRAASLGSGTAAVQTRVVWLKFLLCYATALKDLGTGQNMIASEIKSRQEAFPVRRCVWSCCLQRTKA